MAESSMLTSWSVEWSQSINQGMYEGREKNNWSSLGACVVSSTQYASWVSAIRCPSHLICRCRGVVSRRGGRGKEWTLSLTLGGMEIDVRIEVGWRTKLSVPPRCRVVHLNDS